MATWQQYVDFIKGKGGVDQVLIISGEDGAHWASSHKDFYLRQYKTMIMQEDGTEKEELVNEATNIIKFIKGAPPSQGLRLNGLRKH